MTNHTPFKVYAAILAVIGVLGMFMSVFLSDVLEQGPLFLLLALGAAILLAAAIVIAAARRIEDLEYDIEIQQKIEDLSREERDEPERVHYTLMEDEQ